MQSFRLHNIVLKHLLKKTIKRQTKYIVYIFCVSNYDAVDMLQIAAVLRFTKEDVCLRGLREQQHCEP